MAAINFNELKASSGLTVVIGKKFSIYGLDGWAKTNLKADSVAQFINDHVFKQPVSVILNMDSDDVVADEQVSVLLEALKGLGFSPKAEKTGILRRSIDLFTIDLSMKQVSPAPEAPVAPVSETAPESSEPSTPKASRVGTGVGTGRGQVKDPSKDGRFGTFKNDALDYPTLSQTFMRGTFEGQVRSVYSSRAYNKSKTADFIRAVMDGYVKVPSWALLHTKSLRKRLQAIGFTKEQLETLEQNLRNQAQA